MQNQVKWPPLLAVALLVTTPLTAQCEEDCVGMNCAKTSLGGEQGLPQPKLDSLDESVRQQKLKALLHGPIQPLEDKKKESENKPIRDQVRKPAIQKVRAVSNVHSKAKLDLGMESNLPKYLAVVDRREFRIDAPLSIQPASKSYDKLPGIHSGDRLDAVIMENLTVSANSAVPVSAEILEGPLKGGLFLGEAVLEDDLKRIRIDFKSLRLPKTNQTVMITATAMRKGGEYALEGDFTASDTKFLAGQVVAGTAAGFVGTTLERPTPVAGPFYETPNLANAGKNAIIGGLAETAKRMGERATRAPGYTILKGPIEIQVLVLGDAIQKDST